jgi:hypothetical protein
MDCKIYDPVPEVKSFQDGQIIHPSAVTADGVAAEEW